MPSINLTALLALAALLDLALHRLVSRLFLPASWQGGSLAAAIQLVGAFATHLVGILGILVLVAGMTGLVRRRELFPRGLRFSAAIFGVIFTLLFLATSAAPQAPDRLFLHAKTTQAFLAWLVTLSVLRAPLPWRTRFGVAAFAFPGILHAAGLFCARVGWGRPSLLPGDLVRAGEICAFLALAAAPWLLAPLSPVSARWRRLAWGLGAVALAGTAALLATRFALLQTVALYGLRVELLAWEAPGALVHAALFTLATGGVVVAVTLLVGAGGPARLAGWGVVLLACSGYQIGSPTDLVASACGLLALAVGLTRQTPAAPAR